MQAAKRQKVLVVEDEAAMRQSYRRFFDELHPDEFAAVIVPDGEEALEILNREPMDVLVLDWALPGISGASLAKALRSHSKTRAMSILMVTARATSADTVFALQSGVDDYLTKPFDWNVLLARLRSLSRRADMAFDRQLTSRFPGLELDIEADRLAADGVAVKLTPKEMVLLKIFLSRPDVLHSFHYLWSSAWGHDSDGWEHTLATTVWSLRRKLGPRWGARLVTHKGGGYLFDSASPPL